MCYETKCYKRDFGNGILINPTLKDTLLLKPIKPRFISCDTTNFSPKSCKQTVSFCFFKLNFFFYVLNAKTENMN
jgi:hypothetical protein